MNVRRVLGAAVILLGLWGCGGTTALTTEPGHDTVFEKRSAVDATATLHFDASWNESVDGTLRAGGSFVIDYAPERLPECRASHNGNPGWQITAFARFSPGGTIVSRDLFTYATTDTGPDYHSWVRTTPQLDIPEGTTQVELWFQNASGFDTPCERWDSNFEANYRFDVAAHFGELLFQADWHNVLSGDVARGGVLQVRYAPQRMQSIAQSGSYFASKYHCYGYGCCSYTYDNHVHVRFRPDQPFSDDVIGDAAVEYRVPMDATRVELYFHTDVSTLTWFCSGGEGPKSGHGPDRFYDSNYGENFVLSLP